MKIELSVRNATPDDPHPMICPSPLDDAPFNGTSTDQRGRYVVKSCAVIVALYESFDFSDSARLAATSNASEVPTPVRFPTMVAATGSMTGP